MRRLLIDPVAPSETVLAEAAEVIARGGLVAYPTDTLYGLAADPRNPEALDALFVAKGRPADRALPLIAATAETVVRSDHQIVDWGPYGLVRHPIYTAVSVALIGTMLVYPDLLLFGFAWTAIMCYALKANLEDDYLAQHLPGYEDYRQRVKYRLIPKVW